MPAGPHQLPNTAPVRLLGLGWRHQALWDAVCPGPTADCNTAPALDGPGGLVPAPGWAGASRAAPSIHGPRRCSCRPLSPIYSHVGPPKDCFVQRHLRQIDPSHLVRVQRVKEGNKFSSAKTEVLSASKNFTRSWFFFQPQGQVLLLLA